MLFMVAENRDSDANRGFPKQEVIREAPQIYPPPLSRFKMKPLRAGGGALDG
jgi:hypothetical protein